MDHVLIFAGSSNRTSTQQKEKKNKDGDFQSQFDRKSSFVDNVFTRDVEFYVWHGISPALAIKGISGKRARAYMDMEHVG
jgi:hypothetical protein